MPNFKLFTSNRLEILAEALAEVLRRPLSSPLEPEIIVIQSLGMERWLSMELARHHGICANSVFPFPNTFVHQVFKHVLPDISERSPYDPGVMTWKIMRHLPPLLKRPEFESLRIYLEEGGDLKQFQLSERIADLFDQYLLFRPDMIFQWERGGGRHWQATIWRDLVKGHEGGHRAALAKDFFERMQKFPTELEGLPERVSVFGISALTPMHLQVLAGISRVTQVNLFLMNPCSEYWGDILSDREIKRTRALEGKEGEKTDESLHMEKGNSLLASMGTLGRDFFDMLNEVGCEEYHSFEEPGEKTLLTSLQTDILNLEERGLNGKKVVSSKDRSIQIHSCHSPMREIEVLKDQLLHMFEEDPDLKPTDILVMTPDIETYTPYIQAVFDTSHEDAKWIPFSIADRGFRNESEIIEPFLAILDLWQGRFGVSQVLSVL